MVPFLLTWNYAVGASLLIRDTNVDTTGGQAPPHLAFVCNSNTANKLLVAESYDVLSWHIPKDKSKEVFIVGMLGCSRCGRSRCTTRAVK